MRRLVPILALGLLAACGRDFSLPPAPGKTQPRFLGPIAGFYVLDAPMTALAGTSKAYDVEAPMGTVLVVQDVVPPDGSPDPVAGVLNDVETPALAAPTQTVRPTAPITGTFQDRAFTGSRAFVNGTAPVTATEIAGGGGLDLAYTVCPGETLAPVVVHAHQICDYEPALSGVFAGDTGGCANPSSGSTSYLGLGIRDVGHGQLALALGLFYPDTSQIFAGHYDRFTGCGSGLTYDLSKKTAGLASFTLVDDGKQLTLDLRQGPLDRLPPADLCQQASKTCSDRFLGTRQSGTAADSCQVPDLTGLSMSWAAASAGASHYLDVRVHVVGSGDIGKGTHALGRALADRTYLKAELLRADGKPCLECRLDTSPPDDVALRFDLPVFSGSSVNFRLRVWTEILGIPFAAAMPACVTAPSTP